MQKITLVTLAALLTASLASSLAFAQPPTAKRKMQCWTDDNGVRACGDRVPPQYAKTEREEVNSRGQVVGTKSRQKTDAEVAEDQRKAAEVAAEKKRREEQSAYDRYMLQTFDSVTQMQGVRDTRVQTLDGRIKLAEKSVGETEKSLQALRDRAKGNVGEDGKPKNPNLAKQIVQFESSLVETLKSIAQMKKERDDTVAKFSADVDRYKKLRAGEIQVGSAPPAAPPAADPAAPAPGGQ